MGKPGLLVAVGKGATEKAKTSGYSEGSSCDLANTGTSSSLSSHSCRMGIMSPGVLSHKMNNQVFKKFKAARVLGLGLTPAFVR